MIRERRKNPKSYLVGYCVTLDDLASIECFGVVQNIHPLLDFKNQICMHLKESMAWSC